MTPAQINPHARERFQASQDAIDAHHELLASPAFQRAEDMALIYYNRVLASNITKSQNPTQEATLNGVKMLGVQEFLNEFRCLAEKPLITEPPGRARTLNHNQ